MQNTIESEIKVATSPGESPAVYPLTRVWKVASRWSEAGHPDSSILDIFRNHNVVFVGKGTEHFQRIEIGDLIVISDGYRIVALGPVTGPPAPLPELAVDFTPMEEERFECDDWVWGCRIDYVNIIGQIEEPEEYCRRGACHAIHGRADEFRQIYRNYRRQFEEENQFEIDARSCTLISNPKNADDVLWREGLRFQVPIYQRPYSWKESQIRKLVTDLLGGFRGRNGSRPGEPVFVGTMQLSAKLPYDGSSGQSLHEVIDGQQRLSTLILLLKVLKDHSPGEALLPGVDLSMQLETRVSSGAQQQYWNETLSRISTEPIPESQNPYLNGLAAIIRALEEEATVEDETEASEGPWTETFPFSEFASYLASKVYFVIIETRATLSKTLQIFDAINTAGMDLNGGDVFKIRYYEYLRKMENAPESVFEEIDGIYKLIDEQNQALGKPWPTYQVVDILSLAQQVLVPRFELPLQVHELTGSTFFERLFDTILDVNQWRNFDKDASKTVRIGITELRQMANAAFGWERLIPSLSTEARCAYGLIQTSRYWKYRSMPVLFGIRFGLSQEELETFVIYLSKLLVLLSIWKKRALYGGHALMRTLLEHMFGPKPLQSAADVIEFLHRQTSTRRAEIEWTLNHVSIADNAKAKYLACRVSALVDELTNGEKPAAETYKLLFESEMDIEHIESVNHSDGTKREDIWATWGEELHQIGNLMVLEREINRSFKNALYGDKLPRYAESKFQIVKQQVNDHPAWDLDQCGKRKDTQIKRIVRYLCDKDSFDRETI